jgi:hypothetical protein
MINEAKILSIKMTESIAKFLELLIKRGRRTPQVYIKEKERKSKI